MIALWKAYRARVVHLSALLLTLLFSLVSLVSCNQAQPVYTSINLGIPAAALQSPVKGNLPDSTALHIGITFKIDPRLLHQADQQRLHPGQPSKPQGLGTFGYSLRFYYAVTDKSAGGNAYFDVTSGNNWYYPTTPGWDYATGLGTPNLGSFDRAVSNILA